MFLRLFDKLSLFKGRSKFKTWLYKFVFNIALRQREKRVRRESKINSLQELGESNEPEHTNTDAQELLAELVNQMVPTEREVIMLKIYSELSFKDIAEVLEIGESAVKMRYYRSLEHLKEQIYKSTTS